MSKVNPSVLLLTILLSTSCLLLSFNTNTNTATASSKTITVPDDFSNIQDAVGNATAGDTVYVKSGTYELPEKYDYSLVIGESISLVGENPESTIIVTKQMYTIIFGMSYGIALQDNSSISGFTITGDHPLILLGNGKITNNIINLTSSGRTAIWACSGNISSNILNGYEQETIGVSTEIGANTTISNNIIRNFEVGVYVGSNNLIILNNTLTGNKRGFFIQATPLLIWGNNVENSTQWGLRANFGVNVTYNWWGTNDSQAVSNTISASGYNQTRWGPIVYLPYLNASNPQAKPIQNLIATPNDTPNLELSQWTVFVIIACVLLIGTVFLLRIRKKTTI